MLKAQDPISVLPLIGDSKSRLFENLNIYTVRDILFHIPSKYRDTTNIKSISQYKQDREGAIIASVEKISNIYTRSRKVLTRAKLHDETGDIYAIWFNQPYLIKSIKEGQRYIFEGKIPDKEGSKDISNPIYEIVLEDQESIHLGKITPYYPETAGITSKLIRGRVIPLLNYIDELVTDPIDKSILDENKLLPLSKALKHVHKPEKISEIEPAHKRLAFDELLSVAIRIELDKNKYREKKSYKMAIEVKDLMDIIDSLPYKMTTDQVSALNDIVQDLQSELPSKRLLNGDVGSGKTIVALLACVATVKSGYSACLMAPTSILAKQHYATFTSILSGKYDIDFVIGSEKIKSENNKPKIIIGTHALLYEKQTIENLGLLIIDEQHRFGVEQRNILLNEKENEYIPHYISMSATPIPRTLTNILFGDMSVSQLIEMPSNRKQVITHFVPQNKRTQCFEWIANKITESNFEEKAFIVYPLIEESESLEIKSATKEFERLKQSYFKNLNVELLHGKIKEKEREEIMERFKSGKTNVLVSTSVIEVGVDIKDATIMVIEDAQRFGLAQLHQFRGRVGRGDKQSYCFVFGPDSNEEGANERLIYFSNTPSGFDVSEYDLQTRGPGEVYGLKQSGIPAFKVAKITDIKLLLKCRKVASDIIKAGFDTEHILNNLFR